jgi:DNA-3-methyladenine glycosylase II
MMEFSIRPKAPFNLHLTLQRYRLFGQDAAHAYVNGIYHHAIEIADKLWVYTLGEEGTPDDPLLRVHILGGQPQAQHQMAVEAEVYHTLSLDVDLRPFYHWAEADLLLTQLIGRCYGMRPLRAPTLFEALVTSISAQQVNLAFATTTRSRLIQRYGRSVHLNGTMFYAFPSPASLASASLQELRDMQFSWRKAEYIVNLTQRVVTGDLRLEEFPLLSNEEIIARIIQVKGLGRWTADWLLARGLGRGEVIAAGDLGVRKAVSRFYDNEPIGSIDEIRSFATRWGSFQNLVVHYLLTGMRLPDLPLTVSPSTSARRPSKRR